ncbi:hypothetical protein RHMOL_Rhmol11G0215600 [Rhododendron molle]|uniref:Uncharacterized protein n=1 Tax=Rhododendron molle TaxID=49168 RepID=A0ACC0LVQ1_RHOML|nr:hypothetical protein RHMOL_Rhmol11G0215600 [Rhododendron molle]
MASESLRLSSGGSDAEGLGYEEHRSVMDVVSSYGRPGTVSSDGEAETDTGSERTPSGGSPQDDPDYQVGEEEGDGEEEVEVVNADDDEEDLSKVTKKAKRAAEQERIDRLYELPESKRDAPTLLGYKPTYHSFLKKKAARRKKTQKKKAKKQQQTKSPTSGRANIPIR